MSLDFIARGILAGVGIAAVAGPLGSIIVWRRMANFGDALAHSALLGLCFAWVAHLPVYLGLTSICILVACFLTLLSRERDLADDTILCILAYATLSFGLILATILPGIRIDLLAYLYGDILSVNQTDLIWIYSVVLVVLFTLTKIWRLVLSMTVHEDLAKVEGVPVRLVHWVLVILMAIVFSVAMKLVGILLITALLIIPASAARQNARSPEQMAILASIIGIFSVCGGMFISNYWDWPAGPAIVSVSVFIFVLSFIIKRITNSHQSLQ